MLVCLRWQSFCIGSKAKDPVVRYTAFAGTYKSSFAPFRSDFSDPSSSTPNVLIVFASLPSLSRWQRQSLHLLQHTSKQAPRQMALRQQQPVVASMTIPQRRLERQLLAALTANLTDPRLEENRVQAFLDQLKTRLDAETRRAREAASLDSQLKEELAHLNKELANLVDAIDQHGLSAGLSARLSSVENRISQIQRLRDAAWSRRCRSSGLKKYASS